jgi:hypothetical protein
MQLGTLFRQNPMLGSVVEIAAVGLCGMMTAGGCVPWITAQAAEIANISQRARVAQP